MPIDRGWQPTFGEHEFRTVRESVATLIKTIPVDVTLGTTDVAEDLLNIDNLPNVAQNLIINPSMEAGTPPTGWTAVGSTLTRQTTTPRTGANVLRAVLDNNAAGEGAYFEVTDLPVGWYSVSIYIREAAAGGETVQVRASSDGGVTFIDGNVIATTDAWQRSSAKILVRGVSNDIRLYVVTTADISASLLFDDAQMEPALQTISIVSSGGNRRDSNPPQAVVSPFVDPSGDRFSRWLGVANESQSIREPSIGEIHSMSLLNDGSGDIYIDFDRDSTTSSILLKVGETMQGRKIVKSRVSIINATSGDKPRVRGLVMGI